MTTLPKTKSFGAELYQSLAKSSLERKAKQISFKTGVDPYTDPAEFKVSMRAAQSIGGTAYDH